LFVTLLLSIVELYLVSESLRIYNMQVVVLKEIKVEKLILNLIFYFAL